MEYATLEDVQRRMPQFQLTAVSKPTVDSVQVFLDDTHAQFDAAMENLGYVTPISGAKSLAQCREIVCHGTIAKILYARSAAIGTDVAVQSADRAQALYDKFMEDLANPKMPMELVDAKRTGDMVAKPEASLSGLVVNAAGATVEPRITMETKF